jgi:DNA transformation protein and related proteins
MPSSFQDHLAALFAPLGNVVFRKMFGGVGIFKDGLIFALVAADALYMKADDATSPAYAAEASGPFVYAGMRGKAISMPYWRIPERLLDEPEEFAEWARKAFAVAQRTQKHKSKKTGRNG